MEFTLKNLAKLTQGKVIGNEDLAICGAAGLLDIRPGEIALCADEKHLEDIRHSQAGALVVPYAMEIELPQIEVKDTVAAFTKIALAFIPTEPRSLKLQSEKYPGACVDVTAKVDETAYIAPGAVVGPGALIGKNSHIYSGAVIEWNAGVGENSHIHANAVIGARCQIKNNVIIHAGVVLGADGFGFNFEKGKQVKVPQLGIVVIENDVEIGANTTVDRAKFGRTLIQEGTKIDNLVQIAHNVNIGKHCIFAGQTAVSGSTKIGNYVIAGGGSAFGDHIIVGDECILTGKSNLTYSIPAGSICYGYMSQPLKEGQQCQAIFRRLPEMRKNIKALQKNFEKFKPLIDLANNTEDFAKLIIELKAIASHEN